MKSILVLGAGRSSGALISYLLGCAKEFSWKIVVGDLSLQAAKDRLGDSRDGEPVIFDIQQKEESVKIIASADVVISLLPPHFHTAVARQCLAQKKHLLTASYVSGEMKSFHAEAHASGLLFLNECGLDPGIDHMSALAIIDDIRTQGGTLLSFESFTGGLIAPETDPENPWRYKFTWNPRNVVMAGQGTAKFLRNGKIKYIPYQQLFKRVTEITVPGYGVFEGYANRDSLTYLDTYNLHGIKTMLRGTLRNHGFCSAWNALVQLGCCDDSYSVSLDDSMTHADFMNMFVSGEEGVTIEEKVARQANIEPDGPEMERLRWSGLFSNEKIGLPKGSPAQALEHILSKRWSLSQTDKDMIVMIHRFVAHVNGTEKTIQSSLVVKGEDAIRTAMAKTVGLPLGIAAKLLLQNKIKVLGVQIPTLPEIYKPVLQELKQLGIGMRETVE